MKVLMCIILSGMIAFASQGADLGITCALGFCLDQQNHESDVIKKFGPGKKIKEARCYKFSDKGPFAILAFDDHSSKDKDITQILISEKEICKGSKLITGRFGNIDESILGSDKSEIIKRFGKPKDERTSENAFLLFGAYTILNAKNSNKFLDTFLVYGPEPSNELLFSQFFIQNNKVVAFLISDSE